MGFQAIGETFQVIRIDLRRITLPNQQTKTLESSLSNLTNFPGHEGKVPCGPHTNSPTLNWRLLFEEKWTSSSESSSSLCTRLSLMSSSAFRLRFRLLDLVLELGPLPPSVLPLVSKASSRMLVLTEASGLLNLFIEDSESS